ncbi:thioredoxin [Thalassotalea fusca]
MSLQELSANELDQYIADTQGKLLVDFYAPWCAPCRMIAPLLEQLQAEDEQITIVKVNTDEAPEMLSRYGFRGIPALLLFENSEVQASKVGALSLNQLKEFVSS